MHKTPLQIINKSIIHSIIIVCLTFALGLFGPWSKTVTFAQESTFSVASIHGTYAVTAMEQGGGIGITGGSVPIEAAAGRLVADGNGNISGKITWNMYDYQNLYPDSDRMVLHGHPMTGIYELEKDGFGTMTGYVDFDMDGTVDQEIPGKIVIIRSTTDKIATELWFIGDETFTGGSLPMLHFVSVCPPFTYAPEACTTACPCSEGQGDCDEDADCRFGLVCVNDVGADYGFKKGTDVCERP